MLFGVDRSYRTLMTAEQIKQVLECLAAQESGVWILKSKLYDIKINGNCFLVKRRGGNMNDLIHPLIEGEIMQNNFVQVNLRIRPAYYVILFASITSLVSLFFVFTDDKMTINEVYRSVTLIERLGIALFVIAIPAMVSYFSTIKPVQDAELWMIGKLKLKPVSD